MGICSSKKEDTIPPFPTGLCVFVVGNDVVYPGRTSPSLRKGSYVIPADSCNYSICRINTMIVQEIELKNNTWIVKTCFKEIPIEQIKEV
tara:strand:- start:298 stop:567 length:270 start_codon:yes stop_codon:yes gene_type:complete